MGRRIVVALRPEDAPIIDALRAAGAVPLHSAPEEFATVAHNERAMAVVADVDLPGTLATLHRLRRGATASAQIPVIVLGATQATYAPGSSIHPAMQAGADAFLARPVGSSEIVEQLDALFDGTASVARPMRISGRFSSPPKAGTAVPLTRTSGTNIARASSSASHVAYNPGGVEARADAATDDAQVRQKPTLPAGARNSAPAEPDEVPPPSDPAEVAQPLRDAIRDAMSARGVTPEAFELPPLLDEGIDDLVPPELLEPLDGPMDSLDSDMPNGIGYLAAGGRSPGFAADLRHRGGIRGVSPGVSLMPLTIDGDLRLAGTLGRYGVAQLLSAAWRGRSTGGITVHSNNAEWSLTVNAGHLLAVRGSRAEDAIGPCLARLGYIPREAARFANVPLDAGLRGAAMLAAQGYVPPDGLAPILARAAQEMVFDLLCLDTVEWEVRAVEHSVGVPLPTRALDALLILGARARIEPAQAFVALGGDDTTLTLRAEASALISLPLTAQEHEAAVSARGASLASIVRTNGEHVLPALLALAWLHLARLEGIAHELDAALGPPGPERTRMRALVEAAERKDLLTLLGVSPWATQRAAQLALETRRGEVDEIRARHGVAKVLLPVYEALDEVAQVVENSRVWERYASALRTTSSESI